MKSRCTNTLGASRLCATMRLKAWSSTACCAASAPCRGAGRCTSRETRPAHAAAGLRRGRAARRGARPAATAAGVSVACWYQAKGVLGALGVELFHHGLCAQVRQQHEAMGLVPGQNLRHVAGRPAAGGPAPARRAAVFLVGQLRPSPMHAAPGRACGVDAQVAPETRIGRGQAQGGWQQPLRSGQGASQASKAAWRAASGQATAAVEWAGDAADAEGIGWLMDNRILQTRPVRCGERAGAWCAPCAADSLD